MNHVADQIVEAILKKRQSIARREPEYLIRWHVRLRMRPFSRVHALVPTAARMCLTVLESCLVVLSAGVLVRPR